MFRMCMKSVLSVVAVVARSFAGSGRELQLCVFSVGEVGYCMMIQLAPLCTDGGWVELQHPRYE